jgi:general secretion pathway protein J
MKQHAMCNGGFTLIEMLVALTIFAMVAILAFGAFSFAAREQTHLARSAAVEMAAAACLERMARDLSGVYVVQPPSFRMPEQGAAPAEFRIHGENDSEASGFGRLQFTSTAHLSFEQPPLEGISRIEYYTEPVGGNIHLLRRSDALFPYAASKEPAEDPVLCEHLTSVAFYFFDHKGDRRSRWDSAAADTGYATPSAVRIVLEVQDVQDPRMFETTVALPVQREPVKTSGL